MQLFSTETRFGKTRGVLGYMRTCCDKQLGFFLFALNFERSLAFILSGRFICKGFSLRVRLLGAKD